jgi:hypothetical protein
MSNLIKAAEELEYVPKENLIQMAQAGDTRFPPYLVLAEIQRRTQNEKAYSAMQPPPTTTVAEEKVAEFAQSGLGGMASPLFSPPPEDLPMSPPMQMAASGGLTGYANQGRTTYDRTFGEQLRANPYLKTPVAIFDLMDYQGAGRRAVQQERERDELKKLAEKFAIEEQDYDDNLLDNNPFVFQDGNGKPPPDTTPTTDVFGTLDELKKRMQDVEYKSPTADDLRNDRTSETLMYLGSLIAGSTDRKQFGEGLADLTSKVVASKRADDRFLNEAKLKERGLFSSDLQLATALETLKVKAVQAKNTAAKNKIDEALGMIQAANLADMQTRKKLLDQATKIFLGLGGESATSQADVDAILGGAKN